MPIISVILPTYNRAKLIGRAIDGVLAQTYSDFELIVVDDGSTDNTAEVVARYSDKRIRYIGNTMNQGAAAVRNIGILEARGKLIAFQDSDDEWVYDKLERQMDVFETLQWQVDCVYTDMIKEKDKGKRFYWSSPDVLTGQVVNRKTLDFATMNIGLLTILIKKECLEAIGGFDESLPRYIDMELFLRLAQRYKFYHIKEPLAVYHWSEGITANHQKASLALLTIIEKNFSAIKRDRKFLANQYFRMGVFYLLDGNYLQGMRCMVRAFKTFPLIAVLGFYLLATLRSNYLKPLSERENGSQSKSQLAGKSA